MNDAEIQQCLMTDKIDVPLYDVHAHLSWPDFDNDLEAVIERALERGVSGIAVVSMDASENDKIMEICNKVNPKLFKTYSFIQ
jgi:Tat protein secretion system quality control protein TatD with DNase activity